MKTIETSKFLAMILSLFCTAALSQPPSYAYEGGAGGGYSMDTVFIDLGFPYSGGLNEGYASIKWIDINQNVFNGGMNDGYVGIEWNDSNQPLYIGGSNDGYSCEFWIAPPNALYAGGSDDGYAQAEKYDDFVWTGAIGTGWSVPGNWSSNVVPDLKRKAIIPTGVPFYPHLNAGVFAIGDNPNNGAFECSELWVQDGGLLVTRINNKVENYGNIIIDGTMQVKNSVMDAFQNLSGGVVRITSTGQMLIKP